MSWQHSSGAMWLRDFVPWDVPTVQVFTYGYPSKLRRSGSHALLFDYTTAFMHELRRLSMRNGLEVGVSIVHACFSGDTRAIDETLATTAHSHRTQLWWLNHQAGILTPC